MSIDERIVRMGFDNGKFESGASKSMSTLDKLNEKLKLKGASEGSANIQKSFKGVDFSAMERGILALEKRFSTMGIVGMNVINKISDSLVRSAMKIEQATIGQIKSGGWARAMNIANAKFQIEGLGFDWSQIEESVSYGVKDTAYGLDAAASAASQLAASGVDFQKTVEKVNGKDLTAMHKSLRAISGVAAMTNSSYEDIARIFTTVAGNGRLMGDQLLQLSSRGMNAAAKLAETLHTTEGEIREMVSRGQIDFQTFAFAMDDAFGAHAKEANKTFTGALGNMKAALSRVGEIFASPVINKTNTLFISITGRIDELKNKLKSVTVPRSFDEISDKYKNLSANAAGYDEILKQVGDQEVKFADHFAEMWQSGIDAFSAFVNSVNLGWFDTIVARVDAVTVKLTSFFDLLKDYYGDSAEETADKVNDATKSLKVSAEEAKAARDVIAGKYGYGKSRAKKLTELFGEQSAKNIQAYVDSVKAAGWSYEKSKIKVADANEELAKSEEKVATAQKKAKFKMVMDALSKSMNNLHIVASNLAKSAKRIGSEIYKSFTRVFNINTNTVVSGIVKFSEWLMRLSSRLVISDKTARKVNGAFSAIFEVIKTGLNYLKKAGAYVGNLIKKFQGTEILSTTIRDLWKTTVNLGTAVSKILKAIFKAFGQVFTLNPKAVTSGVNSFTGSLVKLSEKLIISDKAAEKVTKVFVQIFTVVKKGSKVLKDAISFTGRLFKSFKDSKAVDTAKKKVSEFYDNFKQTKIYDIISDNPIAKALGKLFDGISYLLSENVDIPGKITDFVNSIIKAFLNVDWSGVLRLTGLALIFTAIARFFFSLNKIASAIDAVASIPIAIGEFFKNMSTAVKKGGKAVLRLATAESLKIIAESIVMIIGSIIAMSLISPDKLTQSTAVFLAIGVVFAILLKTIDKITAVGKQSKNLINSLNSIVSGFDFGQTIMNSLKPLIETMRLVGAAATMMLALAASVVIISGALAIIEKTGAAKFKNMAVLFGILFFIYTFIINIMNEFAKIKGKDIPKYILLFASLSLFVVAMTGMLAVSAATMALVGHLPVAAIVGVGVATSLVIGTIITIVKMISKLRSAELLSTAAAMVALGVTTSIIMHSLVAVLAALGGVFIMIAASKFDNTYETLTVMGALIGGIMLFLALLVKFSDKIDNVKSVFEKNGTIVLIAGALATMAYVMRSISESVAIISKSVPSIEMLGSITVSLSAIVFVLGAVIRALADLKPSQLLSVSASFIAISSTLLMISIAIAALSRFGGNDIIKAAAGLAIVLASIGTAIAIASASFTENKNGAANILIGMLSISAVLLVLGHVFKQLNNVNELMKKAVVLGSLITVISLMITAMAFSIDSTNGVDTMLAIGGSFILIASAMVILAGAMKLFGKIGPGLKTAVIAMAAFVGIVSVLAALSAIFPTFSAALLSVGKTFLYVGAGSALVGAGFLLMSVSIGKLIGPLGKLFKLIDENRVVAIGVAAVIVIITNTIMKSVDKLSTVLIVGYAIVKDAFSSIGKLLKTGSKDAKAWLSKTQNKGKIAIIAMITSLCSALLNTSPTIFATLGKVLLNGLDFLGRMIPTIVDKLIVLLINLLYGLAKAISANASRLAGAIRAVLESLISLILEAASALIDMVAGWLYDVPLIGSLLGDAMNGLAGMLHSGADKVSKDIEKLSSDSDKGVVSITGGLGTLGGALDIAKGKTDGLTGTIGGYIEALGLATDGVNGLSEAEQNRSKALDTSQTSFQETYDNASYIERQRYDEYAALDDAVQDAKANYQKSIDKTNELHAKAEAAKARYDELVSAEASDPLQVERAYNEWQDFVELASYSETAIIEASAAIEAAQQKADEYYNANQNVIQTLVDARNLQKQIFEIVNDSSRISSDYRKEAYDLLSKAVESQTGQKLDFLSMSPTELKERMKSSNIKDLYDDILAQVVSEHEALGDQVAEELANKQGQVYVDAINKLQEDMARYPEKYNGKISKTIAYMQIDALKEASSNDPKVTDELAEAEGQNYIDAVNKLQADIEDNPEKYNGKISKTIALKQIDALKEAADKDPGVHERMSEATDSFIGAFRDRLDRSADRKLKGHVSETITNDVVDEANSALGILPGSNTSIEGEALGTNFVLGTENGMNDVDLDSFVNKYFNTNLIDAANDAAGVASPSKIMRETGKFVVLGLIKGFTDTTEKLDKAAGGLGTKAIQAFSIPLSRISGLMDGSLEYDPSIKPVVDPSSVTRSAASINSAFSAGSIDVGKVSGTLAADINSLRRNDDALITELRALREDVNGMTEEIANMQMVLDTGVLVGEISGGVDHQLGTRFMRKKRGN